MKSSIITLALTYAAAFVSAVPSQSGSTIQERCETGNCGNCSPTEFWWEEKACCLAKGGPTKLPQCPSDKGCPSEWWWHSTYSCCVPKNPPSNPTPSCNVGKLTLWDKVDQCCKAPTPVAPAPTPSCPDTHFFWPTKACCLPKGGLPKAPACPSGNSCPPGRYWHPDHSCCVPEQPTCPAPTCDSGPFKWWDETNQCCKTPPPTPSGKTKVKRDHTKIKKVSRTTSTCPSDLEECPVAGTSETECVDIVEDLRNCGGCANLGRGRDCGAIPYVNGVTCLQNTCIVSSCEDGFMPIHNGTHGTHWSCVNKAVVSQLTLWS